MTSSKTTAMATLALALVLIGSIATGHLFSVYALLPDTASIKITSPPKGQAVPVGNNLTISGISSDNATTDCHVYAGWNDLKPYHTVVANGAGGVNDYSKWFFTYSNIYHPITNGTNKLTAKISCNDNTGSLVKWHSVNVTGVVPVVVAASSSQSATNTTELLTTIQGQQNSTDKLQQAVFRSLHVQVPTISEINKISITRLQQEQHQQGITPQELQNALKISFDNLSLKQKGTLTQPERDLLGTISPLIQKGVSPQQGIQIASLLKGSTQNAMGPSYNIFDQYGGALKLGIKLVGLYDSGKLRFPDVLAGIGAIYFSSHTGLSPDVLYEFGKGLLSQLPSQPRPTTQVSPTITPQKQPHPITTTDFGSPPSVQDNIKKKDLVVVPIADCYDATGKNSYCVKTDPKRNVGFCNDDDIDCVGEHYVLPNKDATGKWYYPPNALEKAQKDAADKAQKDATKDAQGLKGHGYDSSCPSGHSKGYCGSYKPAYDKEWNELHSPSPIATSKALTAEQPTPTTDKGGNKVELDGYHCTNEGCGDYQDGICKTCGKPGADTAQKDATKDAQGLKGHGYDSSCPSGQSAGFCADYKPAYDKQWSDLHPSVPTSTIKRPITTTAPQPIPTPDKSFQIGVQQQPPTENTPIQSSPMPGLLPSPTSDSPDNSVTPTDKSESGNRAQIDASNDAKGLKGH